MTTPDLNALAPLYDFGRWISAERLVGGYANVNYRLVTDRGSWLLRECHQQPTARIALEMVMMELLRRHEFPAAYPVRRVDGGWISEQGDFPLMVYEFIEGSTPRVNESTAAAAGDVLGRLHGVAPPDGLSISNTINLEGCRRLVPRLESTPLFPREVSDYFADETARLAEPLARPLPTGIVHGDLFPDNTLFDGDRLRAVVDFEEACIDRLLFDVGIAIHGFCYQNETLRPELVGALLRAYEQHRVLEQTERELLRWYVRWAGHGMLTWHLRSLLTPPAQRGPGNPQQLGRAFEFMQRVVALRADEDEPLPGQETASKR